jgi:DnaJ-class molecular chaperone
MKTKKAIKQKCPRCKGKGTVSGYNGSVFSLAKAWCKDCNGTGVVRRGF